MFNLKIMSLHNVAKSMIISSSRLAKC